jgi:hypothetical protein
MEAYRLHDDKSILKGFWALEIGDGLEGDVNIGIFRRLSGGRDVLTVELAGFVWR